MKEVVGSKILIRELGREKLENRLSQALHPVLNSAQDLQDPLSVIRNCTRLLENKLAGAQITAEGFKRIVNELRQATQRLESITSNLIDLAKPTPSTECLNGLKGFIVEKDAQTRTVLRGLFETMAPNRILGEVGTLQEARLLLNQCEPEVVFLSVELPDGLGFELLPRLKARTHFIFLASTEKYAARAFDCDAIDYLLKPITQERLKQALSRLRKRLLSSRNTTMAENDKPTGAFIVKTSTERRLVNVRDIRRIMASGEYSQVYWDDEKYTLLRKSLKLWTTELPQAQFIRIHRHAIVNLAYIDHISRRPNGHMQIHLRGTEEPIPISIRLAPAFNQKFKALGNRTPTNS